MSREGWPHLMRVLADVAGVEIAHAIVRRWGGLSNVRIPAQVSTPHPWADTAGPEAWARIVATLGGQRVDVPRGAHLTLIKAVVLDLLERRPDMPDGEIALQVGCTQRYVRSLRGGRRRRPVDPRQTDLFD